MARLGVVLWERADTAPLLTRMLAVAEEWLDCQSSKLLEAARHLANDHEDLPYIPAMGADTEKGSAAASAVLSAVQEIGDFVPGEAYYLPLAAEKIGVILGDDVICTTVGHDLCLWALSQFA